MTLTRRGFLGALAASIAAPALPTVPEVDGRFELIGKRLILDRPMILDGVNDFIIMNCHIEASDVFPAGEPLVTVKNCERCSIIGTTFCALNKLVGTRDEGFDAALISIDNTAATAQYG